MRISERSRASSAGDPCFSLAAVRVDCVVRGRDTKRVREESDATISAPVHGKRVALSWMVSMSLPSTPCEDEVLLPSCRATARKQIQVRGVVQDVGFRPFVYHLAHLLRLTGYVL